MKLTLNTIKGKKRDRSKADEEAYNTEREKCVEKRKGKRERTVDDSSVDSRCSHSGKSDAWAGAIPTTTLTPASFTGDLMATTQKQGRNVA